MTIRRIGREDFMGFAALYRRGLVETEGVTPTDGYMVQWGTTVFPRLDDPEWLFLGAFDGDIKGFALCYPLPCVDMVKRFIVGLWYVLPEARGVKTAKRMVNAMFAWGKQQGYAEFVANEGPALNWARKGFLGLKKWRTLYIGEV